MLKKLGLTPLHKIIARLGINTIERGAYFDAYEVKAWPADELAILEKSELIAKSSQRKNRVTCQGCERLCTMPVTNYPSNERKQQANAFIICTEDDGGRIEVNFEDLEQWHSSIRNFAAILPKLLQTRMQPATSISQDGEWPLGIIKGHRGYVPIVLTTAQEHGLVLRIGDQPDLPLREVLNINKKGLSIDSAFIKSMADESKEKESYDNAAMRLGQQYDAMKQNGEKNIRAQLAKQEKKSETAIQNKLSRYKELKKAKPVNSIFNMGDKLNR